MRHKVFRTFLSVFVLFGLLSFPLFAGEDGSRAPNGRIMKLKVTVK